MKTIQLSFMYLMLMFIFHLISDVIFPLYEPKIAPLKTWRWMMDEANRIMADIRKQVKQ